MRNNLKILLVAAAFIHFYFICQKSFREYGMFRVLNAHMPGVVQAGEYYTQLAVMQADYSFFSPNIAPDFIMLVSLQKPDGHWVAVAMPIPNTEVDKRLHSCLLGIQRIPGDLQQIIAKSWAARVLDEHPEAKFIRVMVQRKKQPDLADYRKGVRANPEIVLDVLFNTHH